MPKKLKESVYPKEYSYYTAGNGNPKQVKVFDNKEDAIQFARDNKEYFEVCYFHNGECEKTLLKKNDFKESVLKEDEENKLEKLRNILDKGEYNSYLVKDKDGDDFLIIDDYEHDEKALEKELGVEDLSEIVNFGYSDSYTTCDECGVLIETEPDSKHWTPDFAVTDYGVLCADCIRRNPGNYLEKLINNSKEANYETILDEDDLNNCDFYALDDQYENGWYGVADDPKEILDHILEKYPNAQVIFSVNFQHQFVTRFRVFVDVYTFGEMEEDEEIRAEQESGDVKEESLKEKFVVIGKLASGKEDKICGGDKAYCEDQLKQLNAIKAKDSKNQYSYRIEEESYQLKEAEESGSELKSQKQAEFDANFEDEVTRKEMALANHLGCSIDEVTESYDELHFDTPDGEYMICTEEEADEATKDYIQGTIDDLGLDAFTPQFQDWIKDNAMEGDGLKSVVEEAVQYYYDELNEQDLVEEAIDVGVIREEDLKHTEEGDIDFDELGSNFYEQIKEDLVATELERIENNEGYAEYIRRNYGEDELKRQFEQEGYDIDKIVNACIRADGRGHFLGQWNGEEIELENGFLAYKQ